MDFDLAEVNVSSELVLSGASGGECVSLPFQPLEAAEFLEHGPLSLSSKPSMAGSVVSH